MGLKSRLKYFNRFFIVVGGGTIKYDGNSWRTINHVWRCLLIAIHLRQFYAINKWMLEHESKSFEPMSIVMIISMELRVSGPIVTVLWRIFHDGSLSETLTVFEDTRRQLKRLSRAARARSPKKTTVWLCAVGALACFGLHMIRPIDIIINVHGFGAADRAIFLIADICQNIGFYEYVLIMIQARLTVSTINDELPKNKISVSTFGSMHMNILDCIRTMNYSIFGVPVLFTIVGGYIADIVNVSYYHILFGGLFLKYKKNPLIAIVNVILKVIDLFLLYGTCSSIEREIKRTALVLYRMSMIQTDPKIQRQIKWFLLRRMHENSFFKLCGFYKIGYRELLILLAKTITTLIMQIQFKLSIIGKNFT